MSGVLGIIFSYSDRENLRELTKLRTLSSLPFGGKYRIIDFILSNFVNSDIYDVSIITRNNYHSLIDHLGSGKEWDLTRKRGGLRILSPLSNPGSTDTGIYRGTLEALSKNMHSIKRSMAEYVILSGSNILCTMDYQDILKSHMERNADITAVYTNSINGSQIVPAGVTIMRMDDQERVFEVSFNTEDTYPQNVSWSLGIYVIRKSLLESLVADAMSYGRYDFDRDIIQRLAGSLNIKGYEYKKYLFEISSVTGYMKANMSLLSEEMRKNVFELPVYTKVKDSVPAQYCAGCQVENSIISDGCRIEGTVINSILSRGVRIGKGAIVKNSIIMQNTEIMRYVALDHVILDKDVIVRESRQLAGHETYPVVIEKLSIV
ncbi:glucose-1-phosphate adenylyltransferase subunit GlgD [Sinanaerobacter chloroacetimidivorans]|uniref:Glucose-1-phosphate adenylyltransferase subunit GlgD n=1 Tax=Sinanaerobacter chloroacetimidivorans TaxID=2818044 RepID=A0A8J7VZK2_9FIRM|nr:glucose-1-phosphate adenylyltransferase subunit GlgD [Sinanaerobacter chloroacetimidivorans]MBR0596520.1 glucose-1-phosphate adenylyltransferase subunit GlgD [Sinanaerobacter chloroacetimidivorans]